MKEAAGDNDEEEKGRRDEGSKEVTSGSNKRSKRDRRSRRKTNSECSPTPRPSITSDPGLSEDGQGATTGTRSEEINQSSSIQDGGTPVEEKSSPRIHYKREDSILSVGGKPKVVVPSPKGKLRVRDKYNTFSQASRSPSQERRTVKVLHLRRTGTAWHPTTASTTLPCL